jgi:glucosyl-3-phosphoglycerate phosphatase
MGVVEELSARRAGQVLLVVHSGVVRGLLSGCLGISPERVAPVAPASLTVLRLAAWDTKDENRLELFNYQLGPPNFESGP